MVRVTISLYTFLKYLLYLDCFFMLACALLNYAEDDCRMEACDEAEADRPEVSPDFSMKDAVMNYVELAVNAGAVWVVYFFAYDGLLYKLLLFVGMVLLVVVVLQPIWGLSYYWLLNIPNFVGVGIAAFMVLLVATNQVLERTIDLPVGELVGMKVDYHGRDTNKKSKRKSHKKSHSRTPPPPGMWDRLYGGQSTEKKNRSRSKSKSSRKSRRDTSTGTTTTVYTSGRRSSRSKSKSKGRSKSGRSMWDTLMTPQTQ